MLFSGSLPALSAEAQSTKQLPVEQLHIGVILPLSGQASFWGQNPRRGIELALKNLQSKASNVKFYFEDDQCQPQKAVAAFKRLVELHKVSLVLGPVCSSSSLAVAPLADKQRLPLLVFSEADKITKLGDYIFRLWVPNGRQSFIFLILFIVRTLLKVPEN